jgi:hypothetical protein
LKIFRIILLTNLIFLAGTTVSQQNTLLLNSFFKDRYLLQSTSDGFIGTSFYPAFESNYDLNRKIADSSKQYYDLTETLFKKHLFEAKGEDYYITISPIIDLRRGKDRADTNARTLFQNTRGIFVEGDLLKNFSFSTSFYENQARFTQYETEYYSSIGELYPNQTNGVYSTQNAMVPGAARTKPFKGDGFDYAYAQGNIVYRVHPSLILNAGNTPMFVGDGHRSLLLSDNSTGTPFFRADLKILPQLHFTYMRSRLLNLMRKPVSTTVEAYYEPKSLAVNYLTWQPMKSLSISLFEGTVWSKGDSITARRMNPLVLNPIPFLSELVVSSSEISSVTGLNVSWILAEKHRFYGQYALTGLNFQKNAWQAGYRGFSFFGLKDLMVQVEYNAVSSGMYTSSNRRLNFVNYNLPLAHPRGNGFKEVLVRANYEWKRVYVDLSAFVFMLKDHSQLDLLPVVKNGDRQTGVLLNQQMELGYRFNRKMNLSVFANWLYRKENFGEERKTSAISVGFRTGINNHYNDF